MARVNDECAQCRGRSFRFDRAIPLGPYRNKLRDAVIRMKEPRAAALSAATGHLMSTRAREVLAADVPRLLTFSPMHWRRRISRRVNNAERLAKALSRGLGIPVHRRLVVCARQTRKQSLLSVKQRCENVRGAFRVAINFDLDGLHVGLVDDTMTTGATADEIARVLLSAGAARVTVFLAARGVLS
jgi:ComF family protein